MTAHPWSPALRAGVRKRFGQIAGMLVVYAALLFLSAGRLDWPWAWALLGLYVALIGLNAAVLLRRHPEVIAARAEAQGQKGWDRWVGGAWAIASLAGLVVAGWDVRFGWTPSLPVAAHLAGGLAYGLGFLLFSWAMTANAHFAAVVRIQPERGHRVCEAGPYQFVRHPGYAGALLQGLAAPLLLGSLWAFLPAVLANLLMVARTYLEDRDLRAELPGYAEYARRVRFRLAPGLW